VLATSARQRAGAAAPAQSLVDHFRCPERVAGFDHATDPGEPAGYFRFGDDTICFGQIAGREAAHTLTEPLQDAWAEVGTRGGRTWLPFDPDEVIGNLRGERYFTQAHVGADMLRVGSLARALYYGVRPLLPVAIRRHLQRAYLKDWSDIPFPRWPVDRTVEQCLERLLALSMQAQGLDSVPFIWFWPDGAKSCAILTHDVEHLAGRNFCSRLMDLDEHAGIRSSFQIVPEGRYDVPDSLLAEMRARGFEINVHDLNHSGRLFATRENFFGAVDRINAYGSVYGARGFRSGALYRRQAWFDALNFSYDMSVPSVAHLDPQRGGCCTVMPFFIGKILELPVTTIQDYTLFHILDDYSIDVWKRQLAAITRHHGFASFIVHPDYVIAERARDTYRALLDHLGRVADDTHVWTALPRDVDRWWRQRSRMRLMHDGIRWRIVGPGHERARLAFAHLAGSGVEFAIDDDDSVRWRETAVAEPALA
jgi:hypothetical protein